MTKPTSHFSSNLIHLMSVKGVTNRQLSDDLSVSQASVSLWRHKNRGPAVGTAHVLAQYFNVTIEQLVFAELSPNEPEQINNDVSS